MVMAQTRKCLNCNHSLGVHYDGYCLHFHKDIGRRCRCDGNNDGEPGRKVLGDIYVVKVYFATDHAVVFADKYKKVWRYMYVYNKCFSFEI